MTLIKNITEIERRTIEECQRRGGGDCSCTISKGYPDPMRKVCTDLMAEVERKEKAR